MAWGSFSEEASARRLFMDEARWRVFSLVEDLYCFADRYRAWPPAWTFERVAALASQIECDDVAASVIDDSLTAVAAEIRNALIDLAATIEATQPIPYRVTQPPTTPNEPIPPKTLRQFLSVVRGGRS